MKHLIRTVLLLAISNTYCWAAEKPMVGFSLPLSGIVAGMGEGFRRGVELYTREYKELPFEILFDDHKYDGKQVVSSYQSLRNLKKADTIVIWGNHPSEVAAPIAARESQQLITVSSQPVAKDRPTVTNFGFKIDDLAKAVGEHVVRSGYKHFGVLWINLGSAKDGIELIRKQVPIKDYLIDLNTTDFVPQILKMKQDKIDGLLIFTLPDTALTFAKQAKSLHFSVPALGGDIFADDAFQRTIAPLLPDLSLIYGGASDSFRQSLLSTYKDNSYYFESATAYSIMKLLSLYYTSESRKPFAEFVKNVDLPSQRLPVDGLQYSHTVEYGTLLSCQFTITPTTDTQKLK